MSSNEVITSSIASLNGEGVFPFMSDWAETAEWTEWVDAAPGDGVRANIT